MPELQDAVCVLHEQYGELLARYRIVRGEGRPACSGCHACLVRPEYGTLIPAARQIRKRGFAADLWRAGELVEDLHRLRACGRALRVKAAAKRIVLSYCHQTDLLINLWCQCAYNLSSYLYAHARKKTCVFSNTFFNYR